MPTIGPQTSERLTLLHRQLYNKRSLGGSPTVALKTASQSLAYVYGRETRVEADTAKVLTIDEARRVASNIAKLPGLLSKKT